MKLVHILLVSSLVLSTNWLTVARGETSAGQNGKFDADNFEKSSIADQNEDASAFGNSEPFGSRDEGNFFMYQHVPENDGYEWSYRRGNQHHVKEHREKAASPHQGHFKIRARWGDKHGGYGEHYWDYNHGGDSHDEGTTNEEIKAEFATKVEAPSVIRASSAMDVSSSSEATEERSGSMPEAKSGYRGRQRQSSKYWLKPEPNAKHEYEYEYQEMGAPKAKKRDKWTEKGRHSSSVFVIPAKSLADASADSDSDSTFDLEPFERRLQPQSSAGSGGTSYVGHQLYEQLASMPNAYNQFEDEADKSQPDQTE